MVLFAGCAQDSTSTAVPSTPAPGPTSTSRPPTAIPPSPTQAEIDRLLAIVAADPDDAEAHRDLGFAVLQRVRETADPSLYASAAWTPPSGRCAWPRGRRTTCSAMAWT
jgi:hypothetical protein